MDIGSLLTREQVQVRASCTLISTFWVVVRSRGHPVNRKIWR